MADLSTANDIYRQIGQAEQMRRDAFDTHSRDLGAALYEFLANVDHLGESLRFKPLPGFALDPGKFAQSEGGMTYREIVMTNHDAVETIRLEWHADGDGLIGVLGLTESQARSVAELRLGRVIGGHAKPFIAFPVEHRAEASKMLLDFMRRFYLGGSLR